MAPTKHKPINSQPHSKNFVKLERGINSISRMKVAIIGAGVAGLAVAIRMACRGHEVEVFEGNAFPGGKLSAFRLGDYRFDAGPSLFTMPSYVEDLYTLAEVPIEAHFSYERLEVVCNYFWEDGTELSAFADPKKLAKELHAKLGVDAKVVDRILSDSQRKYDICGEIFLEKSLHKLSTWMQPKILKAMMLIPTLDLFKSMNKVNSGITDHPKLIQLLNRYATYNGSNPYKAPGLLTVIPHFEYNVGAFVPHGGMNQITQSLFKLAEHKGVQFHFSTPVEEIEMTQGHATGIKVAGVGKKYDTVISNMDVFSTYKKLLPHARHPTRTLAQERSTSAVIFYWGVNREFESLDVHNILFSENYEQEFVAMQSGGIYHDPTVYINITKKYVSADAPSGCENWFVMINAPHRAGQDWDVLIAEARKNIIAKINRILKIDLETLIVQESLLDPRTIESRTSSHLGALYGSSSNNRMAAFMRHANFSSKINDLYFCGGSVHPGGGIPLCLLSAKIVDEIMHE